MKLDTTVVDYIQRVLKVCKLLGMEEVIIEQDSVRCIHPLKLAAIIHSKDIPELPFTSLGLSRLNLLQTRLDIVRTDNSTTRNTGNVSNGGAGPATITPSGVGSTFSVRSGRGPDIGGDGSKYQHLGNGDNFTVEATVKENTNFIFSLVLKAKGIKIDYRCADPSKIKSKKTVNDTNAYQFKLSSDAVVMLSKGISATESEKVSIISNSEGVAFELVDSSNDVFKYVFAEDISAKFAYRYHAKTLHIVLKEASDATVNISSQGLLSVDIFGITVFIIPYV